MKATKAFIPLAFLATFTAKPIHTERTFKGGEFALIVTDRIIAGPQPKETAIQYSLNRLQLLSITYLKGSAVTKANVRNAIISVAMFFLTKFSSKQNLQFSLKNYIKTH